MKYDIFYVDDKITRTLRFVKVCACNTVHIKLCIQKQDFTLFEKDIGLNIFFYNRRQICHQLQNVFTSQFRWENSGFMEHKI